MYKKLFGRNKGGMRFFSCMLAVVMFVTSIPGQAFVAKAEVRSDWESVQQSPSSFRDGVFGNDIFLMLKNDGTVCASTDGNSWENVAKIELSDSKQLYKLKLTHCGEYFYVYGAEGYLAYSKDGHLWTAADVAIWRITRIALLPTKNS